MLDNPGQEKIATLDRRRAVAEVMAIDELVRLDHRSRRKLLPGQVDGDPDTCSSP